MIFFPSKPKVIIETSDDVFWTIIPSQSHSSEINLEAKLSLQNSDLNERDKNTLF